MLCIIYTVFFKMRFSLNRTNETTKRPLALCRLFMRTPQCSETTIAAKL